MTLSWINNNGFVVYKWKDKFIGNFYEQENNLYVKKDGLNHYFRKYDGFAINKQMADHVISRHPQATITIEVVDNDVERVKSKCTKGRPTVIFKGSKLTCDLQYVRVGMVYNNKGEEQYILMLSDRDIDFSEVEGEARSKQSDLGDF